MYSYEPRLPEPHVTAPLPTESVYRPYVNEGNVHTHQYPAAPASHVQSILDKEDVDAKAWPKFDGTGALDTFLTKVEYFMLLTDMDERKRGPKLIQLLKGRAFTWLSHQPNWMRMNFDEVAALLRKEYGAMKTRDLARLENLKCGTDITKFNDDFNRIGQGCRDILSEEAQKFRYIRLVKPEGVRRYLQSASANSSL